jgi:phage terminase large subunit-like protein
MSLAANRIDVSRLTKAEQIRLLALERAREERYAQRLFFEIYPDNDSVWRGPTLMGGLIQPGQTLHARHKYPKHLECLASGATYRERCAMFANRTGKTFSVGGYEVSCHLTGLYPAWWEGRRFDHPVSAWAAGDTYETTRDIMQLTLLGEIATKDGHKSVDGRGMIPGDLLGRSTWRSGVQDLVDTILVRHVSGRHSFLQFKSTDQGRRSFQGTGRHVCWFDEEPPVEVYGEALIRTATVNGIVLLTFTPLLGLSEVVLSFMPADQRPQP